MSKVKKVVVLGGGTGTATILSGLKYIPNLQITAIVPVSDQGGSSKEFVNAFVKMQKKIVVGQHTIQVVPPGDIANAMIALSRHPQELTELFNYRFHHLKTKLSGHSLRNIVVDAALELWGVAGLPKMAKLFEIQGQVLPAATHFMHLSAIL